MKFRSKEMAKGFPVSLPHPSEVNTQKAALRESPFLLETLPEDDRVIGRV
jgi:hypothetical protein